MDASQDPMMLMDPTTISQTTRMETVVRRVMVQRSRLRQRWIG
jgi:hypothetical protein